MVRKYYDSLKKYKYKYKYKYKIKIGNSLKPKQKKQHFYHHCGAAGHTRPNCYKWLATQKSDNMIASRDQNQFPSSFAPLRDLLKALMFLSNLNGFNSSPPSPDQGFAKRKGSSKVWKEKGSKWFCHLFSLPLIFFFFFVHYLCVFALLFWVSLVLCIALFCLTCFCLVLFSVLLCFVFHIKIKNWKIQKQCVFVYIGTCVPWIAIETKFSKLCISCNLDEHLYA